jgi:hypothetical protein
MSHRARWGAVLSYLLLASVGFIIAPAVSQTPADTVAQIVIPSPDVAALLAEDEVRAAENLAPRYAVPSPVLIRPDIFGTWDDSRGDVRIWRLRIISPRALSLNLGFSGYFMPPGGEVRLYATDGSYGLGPYTAADNAAHGQLWTAVVLSDDMIVELTLPRNLAHLAVLELTSINVGYRGFGAPRDEQRSGSCEIDVNCPQSAAWWNEIPAVGVISTGGSTFCTGFMVNDAAQDQTPFFMTARHCGITSGNAASLVVYWNYQSPKCGQHGGGSLSLHQSGSTWRASNSPSDFTLVQLTQPPNPAWGVTFAGWDNGNVNALSEVAIHHPNTDEKSISFTNNPTTVTSYLGNAVPGDSTHLRVLWESNPNRGATEPGSSGSPIFDQNHRVLGQLHGGYSACGASDMRDWYGRFNKSWTGGGSNSTRLSNWLDPGNTGVQAVDTLVPSAIGLHVSPAGGFESVGSPGGPFAPGSFDYTLTNVGTSAIDYQVAASQAWVSLTNATGTLAAGVTVTVTVSINGGADALAIGDYYDTTNFVNNTNHLGDTSRGVALHVGIPQVVYSWNMDTNPGWTTQGLWAWGHPTGAGGQHGNHDPNNGHTGTNVYGYNLTGDYENSLVERHLTTAAIDCSQLTSVSLRFWRWLNVERPTFDHAYVRISTDGTAWTTIWQNAAEVTDPVWTFQQFDVSSLADRQATVYLRWTMGVTDTTWQYSGWNIDDVELWGVQPAPLLLGDLNCDGVVNFDDIDPFVLALSDPAGYAAAYPNCNLVSGDCNGDGQVNFDDIDAFVTRLGGS